MWPAAGRGGPDAQGDGRDHLGRLAKYGETALGATSARARGLCHIEAQAAHQHGGPRFVCLAAYEIGRRADLVGCRSLGVLQRATVHIEPPALIEQWGDPCDTDGHSDRPAAKWTTKRIANNHRERDPKVLLQAHSQCSCGGVGIGR